MKYHQVTKKTPSRPREDPMCYQRLSPNLLISLRVILVDISAQVRYTNRTVGRQPAFPELQIEHELCQTKA